MVRRFAQREIHEAQDYAAAGGQALHVWNESGAFDYLARAAVFRRTRPWAHLFDQDRARLVATAKRLGVRVIAVEREGGRGQHIDLCGAPLQKALALCKEESE